MNQLGATRSHIPSLWRRYINSMRVVLPETVPVRRIGSVTIRFSAEMLAAITLVTIVSAVTIGFSLSRLTSTTPSQTSSFAAVPQISDAEVIEASDGHNGTPLVLISGAPAFPLAPNAGLGAAGAPVEAQQITVLAVTPVGFWMGENADQRMYVVIPQSAVDSGSLAPNALRVGEYVDVSGRVTTLADVPGHLGISDSDQSSLLTQQNAYIQANSVRPTS